MNDEKIIELFFERSEKAIADLDAKYGRVCRSVSLNILNNAQDAEECVNDAYLAAWEAIPPAKPESLSAFICKIVRNLSLKRYSQNTAKKRNSIYDVALDELEECLASADSIEKELETEELRDIIESFLDSLSAQDRVIFMRRYWFCDTYADISRQVGLSEKNISVRLTRIRKNFKKYLLEREVFI